jgi:peptidoglycan hydrolase-like protein with peptidoglycan-binding domain
MMGNIRRTDVIRLAKKYADEGYTEGSNNWTIFSQILDDCNYYTPQKKQGQPWCHNFINAIFLMSSDSEEDARKYDAQNYLGEQPPVNNLSCGCTYGADYFRAIGQFYDIEDAYVGDIIYFGERGHESHVGLIVDLDYNDDGKIITIHTVEGNKGDAVRYGEYSINSTYIAGVGKATFFDYYDDLEGNEPEPEPVPSEAVTITLSTLSRGSTGGQVNTLKALLNEFGFSDELPLDGDFDWDTEQAVNHYKENYGLEPDGIVDSETWNLLLK